MVAIEVTTQCNFDCDYCYTKNYPNKMMEPEVFRRIVDEWASYSGNVDMSLSGEGESLLHPKFWEFVKYIRATTKHSVSVITNGSTLTPTNIQLMREHLTTVRVSLDTMDPEYICWVHDNTSRKFVSDLIKSAREQAQVIALEKAARSHFMYHLDDDFDALSMGMAEDFH